MSTIPDRRRRLEGSKDAVAFARRLVGATSGRVVIACACPYSDVPNRAAHLEYRAALEADASAIARR
jgi:hypothetical protein